VPRNKVAVNTLAFHEGDKRDCAAKWSMIALYQVATRNLAPSRIGCLTRKWRTPPSGPTSHQN
jgi:hypothetical protein